jgi:hypothetical protein
VGCELDGRQNSHLLDTIIDDWSHGMAIGDGARDVTKRRRSWVGRLLGWLLGRKRPASVETESLEIASTMGVDSEEFIAGSPISSTEVAVSELNVAGEKPSPTERGNKPSTPKNTPIQGRSVRKAGRKKKRKHRR